MRRALIYNGAFTMGAASLIFFLKGKQARKERDERKLKDSLVRNT
jgi:hypothetical protein